ncbi:hypothetical protein ACLOJK_007344 [Asimina triloba]
MSSMLHSARYLPVIFARSSQHPVRHEQRRRTPAQASPTGRPQADRSPAHQREASTSACPFDRPSLVSIISASADLKTRLLACTCNDRPLLKSSSSLTTLLQKPIVVGAPIQTQRAAISVRPAPVPLQQPPALLAQIDRQRVSTLSLCSLQI